MAIPPHTFWRQHSPEGSLPCLALRENGPRCSKARQPFRLSLVMRGGVYGLQGDPETKRGCSARGRRGSEAATPSFGTRQEISFQALMDRYLQYSASMFERRGVRKSPLTQDYRQRHNAG